MDILKHLKDLGEEKLNVENIYLQLITKASKDTISTRDNLVAEAKELLDEISLEYFSFLSAIQNKHSYKAA